MALRNPGQALGARVIEQGATVVGAAAIQAITGSRTDVGEVYLYNIHAAQILYIGGPGVTVANGMPIEPVSYFPFPIPIDRAQDLFVIASGVGTGLRWLVVR
jgi:hypothetical protein